MTGFFFKVITVGSEIRVYEVYFKIYIIKYAVASVSIDLKVAFLNFTLACLLSEIILKLFNLWAFIAILNSS